MVKPPTPSGSEYQAGLEEMARGTRVPARVTATISLPSITSAADHTAALTALVPPPLAADHAGVAPTYSAATPWVRTMTAFVEDNDASGLKLFAVSPTPATSQRTGLAAGITKEREEDAPEHTHRHPVGSDTLLVGHLGGSEYLSAFLWASR